MTGGADALGAGVLLVDTSVWIELFRKPPAVDIRLIDLEEVVTCLPIVQEVLQGFADQAAFRKAREAMLALPVVESPLSLSVFEDAVDLYRDARRRALTIRSSVDCLIAACALRNDLTVLHHDRDFDLLARISSLRARKIPRAR